MYQSIVNSAKHLVLVAALRRTHHAKSKIRNLADSKIGLTIVHASGIKLRDRSICAKVRDLIWDRVVNFFEYETTL